VNRTVALFVLTAAAAAQPTAADLVDLDAVRAWRAEHAAAILQDFATLLAIPNVASDAESIRRNAVHVARALEERGVTTELWTTGEAPPIVYGRLDAEGAERTLGIYVHYDGQPVEPERWTSPPWEPTLFTASLEAGGVPRPLPEPGEPIDPEWRLYARSAGDDKAPIPALLGALDALAAAATPRTSNLVFFFEGEEEAGSEHLQRYIEEHREQLEVDAWIFCDGPVHQSRRPQLVFGVRGYTGIDLTVYGPARYLHSGHYGNWAPNPAHRLARLLASMKDDDGRVLVAGFYDDAEPPGTAERSALAALPAIDDSLRSELGLAETELGNAPLAERLLLPSLNIRGLASATVGETARNIIPTEATASIDIRLVKGDDPARILDRVEDHVRGQGYMIVREEPDLETRRAHPRIVRSLRREGYPAARTAMDLPISRQIVAAARHAAGGDLVLMPSLGGSLPLYLFTDLLGTPAVIAPIANHDDNQHAPDENLRLANLWYGIDLMASLLTMD
jgi:acetylornithine deacetylase/succinyl-diaminopimelate desuccinylase-like protein